MTVSKRMTGFKNNFTRLRIKNYIDTLKKEISELKEERETLLKKLITTEKELKGLFHNQMIGYYQSLPEGRFITVNPTFTRILGYDSPQDLLVSIQDIGRQFYVNRNDRVTSLQQILDLGAGSFDIQVFRKNGSIAWISNHTWVVYDDAGNILCFEGLAVDITLKKIAEEELNVYRKYLKEIVKARTIELESTNKLLLEEVKERRKVEEELRLSEEKFSKAFTHSPISMSLSYLHSKKLIDVNEAWLKMHGYSKEDFAGNSILEFHLWSDGEELNKFSREIEEKGYAYSYEANTRTKSGQVKLTLVSGILLKIFNEKVVLISKVDTTELRRYQTEVSRLDKFNLIGEMSAGIAHEIRNPLTTVKGFLQILESKKEYSPHKDYFSLMISELERANEIISGFLSLVRTKPINKKTHNLNDIMKNLIPLIEADALNSDKYIETEFGIIEQILVDDSEMRQLVLNLVRNGLEAMQPGKMLRIKTFMENNMVVLSVMDQGNGIAPENVDKIGNPFFTTKDNGTGLGLATCYSIAARNNATIHFDTGKDGTTFYVRFSLEKMLHEVS
jgi:two-component system, sporulation sensor kinase E